MQIKFFSFLIIDIDYFFEIIVLVVVVDVHLTDILPNDVSLNSFFVSSSWQYIEDGVYANFN